MVIWSPAKIPDSDCSYIWSSWVSLQRYDVSRNQRILRHIWMIENIGTEICTPHNSILSYFLFQILIQHILLRKWMSNPQRRLFLIDTKTTNNLWIGLLFPVLSSIRSISSDDIPQSVSYLSWCLIWNTSKHLYINKFCLKLNDRKNKNMFDTLLKQKIFYNIFHILK
jgi:hypothetical protein